MTHPRILVQLDSDSHASVFDAVVAIDAGVEHLLQYAAVEASNARGLVHGAMFTRGPGDLKHTAIFIGGSNVAAGEAIAEEVRGAFFGPIRCSVMLDGNGSNTTAAAAVLCVARHVPLAGQKCLVLGGTGPVGLRVARLLLGQQAEVLLASRDQQRAAAAADTLRDHPAISGKGQLTAVGTDSHAALHHALQQATVVIACGAAGVELLSEEQLAAASQLKVAVDLNAVPPAGIAGIGVTDKAVERHGRFDYGAIGTGGLKMKIHRASIQKLFTRNDLVLDAEQIFEIGQSLS
jgi:methylenetetrahydrofolate/methylenetetrahydromethanopterin dehydrogenase (NADP+)